MRKNQTFWGGAHRRTGKKYAQLDTDSACIETCCLRLVVFKSKSRRVGQFTPIIHTKLRDATVRWQDVKRHIFNGVWLIFVSTRLKGLWEANSLRFHWTWPFNLRVTFDRRHSEPLQRGREPGAAEPITPGRLINSDPPPFYFNWAWYRQPRGRRGQRQTKNSHRSRTDIAKALNSQ